MMIKNVMIVSGEQQRDSAIHIYIHIYIYIYSFLLSTKPLSSRLPYNIKQSSLCYTVGTCWYQCKK